MTDPRTEGSDWIIPALLAFVAILETIVLGAGFTLGWLVHGWMR